MKSSSIIREELIKYNENELIFASKIYKEKLFNSINEAAYYKMLERMCKSGEIAKASKGIYYIPTISKYGVVPLPEKQIIDFFTKDNTGTIIGYNLYNSLNLTTQVSKSINILTSSIEGFSKNINNIIIKQVDLEYTTEIKKMISGLEVLQNFYEIQDLNYDAFIKFSHEIAKSYNNEVFKKVIQKASYKKSTISFLKEILNYYNVSNNLDLYLSSLSSYKHPKMEEIYKIARISR